MSAIPDDLGPRDPADPAYGRTLRSVGLIDRTDRVRLAISGPDRAKFLHNLTTNEVKKLSAHQGCEAFVTSPQGKTLGFISIHALETRLIVRADAAALDLILPHFQKYGLFDEIQIDNQAEATFELHAVGPRADALFEAICRQPLPSEEYAIGEFALDSVGILAIRESPTGRPGFTLIGPIDARPAILDMLRTAGRDLGMIEIDQSTFDTLRIEAGTPIFGRDLTEKNLPQELLRDDRAISFVKGCYLGQETVARIDALGHVNQTLRGIRMASDQDRLEPGDRLQADGKVVGHLTSTAFSTGWNSWIALGYVREAAIQSQAPVEIHRDDRRIAGQVTIHELPMLPPREP